MAKKSATPFLILMGRAFLFLLPLWFVFTEAEAIDLTATGGWSETVDASDLISGAGSNLIDTYESTTNATDITVYNCQNKNDNWRIDVRKTDGGGWPGDFTLYVKRTSNGTGSGSISGGLSYIQITSIDTQLFSGAGNRSNINVQYQLSGMSISISPNTYNTTITFTVVDIP